MESQAVIAAQEAAEIYTAIFTRIWTPETIAAVVVYVIAQLAYGNELKLTGITEATGVHQDLVGRAYKDLYPHLSTIIPNWFAKASDLEKLPCP